MPTTRLKNALYRAMLPFSSDVCPRKPVSAVDGHPLQTEKHLIRLMRKHHVLGSATVLSNGQSEATIFTFSDHPAHHPGPDTYFRVASITKIATAILIMKLQDQGRADIDRPVSEYMPVSPVPPELTGVTLRQLLSHTSGLADPPSLENDLLAGRPFPEVIRGQRIHEPGSGFQYSNLGYGLIGCVIEAVTGLPLDQAYATEIFDPLKMDATLSGCSLREERILPIARIQLLPWRKSSELILTQLGRQPLDAPDPLRHYGHSAGSMYTTAASLRRLLDVLMKNDGSFLSQQAVREMRAKHASYGALSPTLSYGLGLLRIEDPTVSNHLVVGHQGFAYGCADGAFWEEGTQNQMIFLNGGCSEARNGRLGSANRDMAAWAFRKELTAW